MDPVSAKAIDSLLSQIGGAGAKSQVAGSGGFGDALKEALQNVSNQQKQADQLQQRFQMNDPTVGIEETMLAMNTASVGFQALVQVRNKLVSAYNDVMNMQV